MGSYICAPIDDKINEMIFSPPTSSMNKILQVINDDKHYMIKTKNNNLISVYHSTPQNKNGKYIIWCHGNATCLHQLIPYFQYLKRTIDIGVIAFDYQGYGLSQGQPTESNCYDDLEAIMSFAINKLNIKKKYITLIGRSLGTGIVVNFAAKFNWKYPIILISPYKTISKVIVDSSIVRPIDKFRTEAKIHKVNCPIKIFHGMQDSLINITHAITLYDKISNKLLNPTFYRNADHNDILKYITMQDYLDVINLKY